MRNIAFAAVLAAVCLGMACGDNDASIDEAYEGDEAGECSDGADNDQDMLFDCDDDGCAGSPDCAHEGDEAGECSDGADNDQDMLFDCDDDDCAGSPDCGCAGACPAYGDLDCNGNMVRECLWGPDGCLTWFDSVDCELVNQQCLRGACVSNACAVTGSVCTTDDDCGGPAVEITGTCLTVDAGGGAWACGYDTRIVTDASDTCEGETFGECSTNYDCPPGSQCASHYDEFWCMGNAPAGICSKQDGSIPPCADNSECTYTEDDFCVACGDGVVDPPFEECEDGNLHDGDGCSSKCRYEGVCYGSGGPGMVRCATNDDCFLMACGASVDCVCVLGLLP